VEEIKGAIAVNDFVQKHTAIEKAGGFSICYWFTVFKPATSA
jgi:hypothetical protein